MRRLARTGALSLFVVAALGYAAWALALFIAQRQLIFPRHGLSTNPEVASSIQGLRTLWLDVASGAVEAWFLPPRNRAAKSPALLFAHGNAELIDYFANDFEVFADRGLGVMLLEFPGYGRSAGAPSQGTVRDAALAAYDSLAAQAEVDADRIVPYGRSLGGGAAAIVADERPVPALILESSFTSLRPFARRFLFPGFLVRDPFDNLAIVRAFLRPVLVVHGRHDQVVPYWHGTDLAESAPLPTFVTYECGHNDCPPAWGLHVDRVLAFLEAEGIVP